jgi:hypothetical protein
MTEVILFYDYFKNILFLIKLLKYLYLFVNMLNMIVHNNNISKS